MRLLMVLGAVAALAACGADGEPIQPTASATVGVGTNGTYAGARVGVRQGPFTISYGLFQ